MPRRRSGAGGLCLSALTSYLLFAPFILASQQQKQQSDQYGHLPESISTERRASVRENGPLVDIHLKSSEDETDDYEIDPDTLSAPQTFAPARQPAGGVAVRAPAPAADISAPLLPDRHLQDWVVEDLILLATVDGSIYARDRKTGKHRWGPITADTPVVETIYHQSNDSELKSDSHLDKLLWVVEPNENGDIYLYYPSQPGMLQRLGLDIKRVQNASPYSAAQPPVVYNADKSTTLYNLDAATGDWLRVYGSRGSALNDRTTCRVNRLGGSEEQECGLMGSLTLGRVTYVIRIEHRDTAQPICTIKYSEWVPNQRDLDLKRQYSTSMDQSYVYSRHDGRVLALKHGDPGNPQPLWTQRLSSPTVRVFDVARPANTELRDSELVILPQPIGPMSQSVSIGDEGARNRAFMNKTDGGGWYVLSEQTYPTVTKSVRQAQCYDEDWLEKVKTSGPLSTAEFEKSLVGVHPLSIPDGASRSREHLFTIDGPSDEFEQNLSNAVSREGPLPPSSSVISESYIITTASSLNVVDGLLLLIFFALLTLFYYRHSVFKNFNISSQLKYTAPKVEVIQSQPDTPATNELQNAQEASHGTKETREVSGIQDTKLKIEAQDPETLVLQEDPATPKPQQTNFETPAEALTGEVPPLGEKNRQVDGPRVRIVEPFEASLEAEDVENLPDTSIEKEKKKARRGTRGGKAHKRKKNKQEKLESEGDGSVDLSVEKALEISKRSLELEPDITTSSDQANASTTDIDEQTLQIGHLTVYQTTILGFGSHGTRVFKGSFGGRDVAVKCMLKEFYDVASHEVTLLQESDDHPNVVRYYDKESAGGFLYIALELCPATLAEVVDRPQEYSQLLGPRGLNSVDALRQITMGIKYLHSLKIVHRDIKPENILVATPKKLRAHPDLVQPARLLISDFGLCKKLDVDQSSFRATTAHAAGTSGWRAPELLVDDENEDNTRSPSTNSTQHSTNSEPVVLDTVTNRRATRAIDVFALGCVFYYVLSNGNHPFDGISRGEARFMRELNIIRGQYRLDDLSVLGAYQGEANDLISHMIAKEPKARPDAGQVLAHPFFWSAGDRLDFLCHVSDQFEFEPRDPPSFELETLEAAASVVLHGCKGDFMKMLPPDFVSTLGKQRKYQGGRMLDLLRALRNKKNHYEDMPESVKARVGSLPEGYLLFWTTRFPKLLMACHQVVLDCGWELKDRFRKFYEAPQ